METTLNSAKVTQLCRQEFATTIGLLSELIAAESTSGNEKVAADALLAFFADHGIPALRDERGSVLAVLAPENIKNGFAFSSFAENPDQAGLKKIAEVCSQQSVKILAFNGHIDVVAASNCEEWMFPPFKLTRDSGRLYGRGTCDMKGAVSAIAGAISLCGKADSQFQMKDLILGCFCTEEEVGEGLAFKELIEWSGITPSAVVLGEPSQLDIARGQRGKLEFLVQASGKRAHTSVPEVGENAAYKLAKALLCIERLNLSEVETFGLSSENVLKRNTIVATSIKSFPEVKSFVPDRAEAHVIARLSLEDNFASISKKLQKMADWPQDVELVQFTYRSPSYTGKVSNWFSEHPAWETREDNSFFKKSVEVYKNCFGKSPVVKIWPFSTDGVYSAGMAKIPTIGIGPGKEAMAHQNDEWIEEEDLLKAQCYYVSLIVSGII
jgi:putative selenium metabolism hydrolase